MKASTPSCSPPRPTAASTSSASPAASKLWTRGDDASDGGHPDNCRCRDCDPDDFLERLEENGFRLFGSSWI